MIKKSFGMMLAILMACTMLAGCELTDRLATLKNTESVEEDDRSSRRKSSRSSDDDEDDTSSKRKSKKTSDEDDEDKTSSKRKTSADDDDDDDTSVDTKSSVDDDDDDDDTSVDSTDLVDNKNATTLEDYFSLPGVKSTIVDETKKQLTDQGYGGYYSDFDIDIIGNDMIYKYYYGSIVTKDMKDTLVASFEGMDWDSTLDSNKDMMEASCGIRPNTISFEYYFEDGELIYSYTH